VLEVHDNYNEWVRNKVSLNVVGVIFNVIGKTIIIKDYCVVLSESYPLYYIIYVGLEVCDRYNEWVRNKVLWNVVVIIFTRGSYDIL